MRCRDDSLEGVEGDSFDASIPPEGIEVVFKIILENYADEGGSLYCKATQRETHEDLSREIYEGAVVGAYDPSKEALALEGIIDVALRRLSTLFVEGKVKVERDKIIGDSDDVGEYWRYVRV